MNFSCTKSDLLIERIHSFFIHLWIFTQPDFRRAAPLISLWEEYAQYTQASLLILGFSSSWFRAETRKIFILYYKLIFLKILSTSAKVYRHVKELSPPTSVKCTLNVNKTMYSWFNQQHLCSPFHLTLSVLVTLHYM